MNTILDNWTKSSWQTFSSKQIPAYASEDELEEVMGKLSLALPIVNENKINELKKLLAEVAKGQKFLLQAGDCAESFDDNSSEIVCRKVNQINYLAELLADSLAKDIVQIGRIAGQYAKPRTFMNELLRGEVLPNYRGGIINAYEAIVKKRHPDPQLMLRAYEHAYFVNKKIESLSNPIYISHEALLLYYEQALTHKSKYNGRWYNLSTHFPWLGMRTLSSCAHIEYLRGIANPIGIKIGSVFNDDEISNIITKLNPENEPGKLMLITRMGCDKVEKNLPKLINMVKNKKMKIIWCCDPMHGNTHLESNGKKIRIIENIINEIEKTISIHKDKNTILGGIHLEVTCDNVIECFTKADLINEPDFIKSISLVDPRLNEQQVVTVITEMIKLIKKNS